MKIYLAGLLIFFIYLPILIFQLNNHFRKEFSRLNSKAYFSIFIEVLIGLNYALLIILASMKNFSDNWIFVVSGMTIYFFGLVMTYMGYYVFLTNSGLITRFPFNISRNPTYFYGFVAILGIVISVESFLLSLLLVLQGVLTHNVILNEEKYLEGRFGKKYLEYKKRVRRYF